MSVPRVWTNEEVRDKLLRKIAVVADYWAKLPDKTDLEKCNGVAFSILAELDGCGMDIPGFIIAPIMKNQRFLVAPSPHEDDEEYNKSNGENWFPPTVDVPTDIGGALHELYHKFEKHK